MYLISQKAKRIMEECKSRARDAGLSFEDETLELIVTNRDLLELSPKNMIPTMYDYWVHDLQIFQSKKIYELFPSNPYETVVNTRPAISYYNDNNPDWMNTMIFYHVLGHIDFFQNNSFFEHTWDDDFCGVALADKRIIAKLRSEKGRWVDYAIEFARGMDNLVNYHDELSKINYPDNFKSSDKVDFYFGAFLNKIKKINQSRYLKEIDNYNRCKTEFPDTTEINFFSEVSKKYPEFETVFEKEMQTKEHENEEKLDVMSYVIKNSSILQSKENEWMKTVIEIVRKTSLYFEPQRRTKILNEGWASYWHEKLFRQDKRMSGHEIDFALLNSKVMTIPRAGLNPYGIGWKLLMHIEDLANKGKISYDFQRIKDVEERKAFDKKTGEGLEYLLFVRENYSDFTFINDFVDQDFVDKNDLFVTGRRLNMMKGVWEYYIKSKDARDYKKMIIDSMYHPPHITIEETMERDVLYLNHHFEGKPLIKEYIENTMLGIEFLFGDKVYLETSEIIDPGDYFFEEDGTYEEIEPEFGRVLYIMEDGELSREELE